jgi:RNA polymerase sigma factor (sigma-70 family)
MHEPDDMTLLREYSANGSEAAFANLVSRRVSFVYSAAIRQVGNPHQAQEVTQAVFVILAQKAGRLSNKTNLMSWLFKATRFVALAQRRSAAARQRREQEFYLQADILHAKNEPAWELISPLLDQALMRLGETDRQTILLHYFDKKSFAEIGASLGMAEPAARKRASRALEKLRKALSRHGVVSTATIIGGAMAANAVQAAPVTLANSVTGVALTKGATAASSTLILTKGALKIMAWTKTKIALAGAIILAVSTTALVIQHHLKEFSPHWATLDKASFTYAGYGTPQATLQTIVWTMAAGDPDAYLASCTPEERARREESWTGKTKEAVSAEGKRQLAKVTKITILNQTSISSTQAVITVLLVGTGNTESMRFSKARDGWKYAGE